MRRQSMSAAVTRRVRCIVAVFLLVGTAAAQAVEVSATIAAKELLERRAAGTAPILIDVRSREEFAADRIPGAMNIPLQHFAARYSEVEGLADTELVLYCESGPRAQFVAFGLRRLGFSRLRVLEGHMSRWRQAGHPMEGHRVARK